MTAVNTTWLHVVSEQPPEAGNGHGITLARIVRNQPGVRLGLVCNPNVDLSRTGLGSAPRLSPTFPHLPERSILRGLSKRVQFGLQFATSRRVASFFKAHQPCAVLLVPMGDGQLFLAGESAATALDLPTVLWVLDDWASGAGRELTWARNRINAALRRSSKRSVARFAVSKEMAERYESQFGCKWEVLCNGVEASTFSGAVLTENPATSFKIGFFGAVYSIQVEPLEALCESCGELGIEVIVYGDVDPNLRARLTRFKCLTLKEPVPECVAHIEMKKCDALYLPYSFDLSASTVVETSFPTKMADYVVSGKPVVVNGPPNSTIIKFSRRTGWGIPVDEQGAGALSTTLSRLRREYPQHICNLGESAARAAEEIDLSRMRARFHEVVSDAFRRESATATLPEPEAYFSASSL